MLPLGIDSKEIKSYAYRKNYMRILIEILFTIAQNGNSLGSYC